MHHVSLLLMGSEEVKKRKTLFSFFKHKEHGSTSSEHPPSNIDEYPSKHQRLEVDISLLVRDPGVRIPIWQHPVNQRDEIRRAYIKMEPYQPILSVYPPKKVDAQNRRFQSRWFKQFPWLEYSPSKDATFFFPCFLFDSKNARFHAFITEGFNSWKRVNDGERCSLLMHVGVPTSAHNNVVKAIDDLMNVPCHIDKVIRAQSLKEKQQHRLRLKATIESIQWLSLQACALRGHDESTSSNNQGNLIEMIRLLGRMNDGIGDVVLEKAPQNAKYTSPKIQKDILHILAKKVRSKIRDEIGNAKYCILVDEAKDISSKEQMAIVLRFVDANGFVREQFFDIVHVSDTTAATLKREISKVLARHDLHICNMRGQGYDGASNMRGSWNGLQALFLRDCPYAYYIHCFAHRLQLALVAAAEKEVSIWLFFSKLTSIVNMFSASPKRQAELHAAQAAEIENMIASGERDTGRGANQIGTLQRAGKTRWSSHFEPICSVVDMYSAVMTVLENIMDGESSNLIKGEAASVLMAMRTFDFIFILRLMQKIMAITNFLCQSLQKKSLDILNAMDYVSSTKVLLHTLREEGFDCLYEEVVSVFLKYDIKVPNMNSCYKSSMRRSRQQSDSITVDHPYRFDIFNAAIDFQVEEINNRFNDENVELLKLSTSLDPRDGFKLFDIDRVYTLAEKVYPDDFCEQERYYLRGQLEHYRVDIIRHEKFQNISTIFELCQRLVETNKAEHYHLIDRLIRLVLTLLVSTATTERAFSAMKIVKPVLCNKMEEEFLANNMVIYIERELSESVDIESIIDEFYSMKNRRAQLQ